MAVNELNLCMGCMSPLFEGETCSVCGYHADASPDLNYLQPGSGLGGRYLVGKMVADDPEGVWYVGYDRREEVRVWLREYAPGCITRRDHENFSVQPLASSEAQYKALMSDFEDLCRSIMALPAGEKVLPVTDLLYENNTIYAVYRYIKTISLESFLARSGGKIPWRHAKKLLMPLFHTVVNFHKAGLIHRGLSPRTVHLDQSGALWVTCFSIAAARTNKSETGAQLFEGYAAPEQYALNSWQGNWTDVYALGAITYRTVTGENPPAALDRVYGDDLLDSQMISGEMTENVVSAINRALAVEVEDRIQSAELYISGLLADAGSNTAVYTAAPRKSYETPDDSAYRQEIRRAAAEREAREKQPPRTAARFEQSGIDLIPPPGGKPAQPKPARKGDRREKRPKRKRSHPVLMLIFSAFVATALLAGAMYWFSTNYLTDLIAPAESEGSRTGEHSMHGGTDYSGGEAGEDDKVPRFVGTNADSLRNNEQLSERYELVFEEKFNDVYEPGVVCDQQPVEGTKMPNRGRVTIYVSKGPELIEMPAVVGMPIEDAIMALTDLELNYQVIEVYDKSYEPDVIERAEPEPGAQLNKEKDTVFLYIRKVVMEESSSSEDERDDRERSASRVITSRKSSTDSDSSRRLKPREE